MGCVAQELALPRKCGFEPGETLAMAPISGSSSTVDAAAGDGVNRQLSTEMAPAAVARSWRGTRALLIFHKVEEQRGNQDDQAHCADGYPQAGNLMLDPTGGGGIDDRQPG